MTKMNHMIYRPISFIVLTLLLVLSGLVFMPGRVAAAPVCYWLGTNDGVFAEADECDEIYENMSNQVYDTGLQDGFCYSMSFYLHFERHPSGSAECNDLAARTETTNTTAAQCWRFVGPFSEFDQVNYDISQIVYNDSLIPCNEAVRTIIQQSNPSFSTFQSGHCYVISTVDTDAYRSTTCNRLLSDMLQANLNEQVSSGVDEIPNTSREEVDEACKDKNGDGDVSEAELSGCINANPITKWIIWTINLLSVGAGVIITLMIVIGGIQYSTAGANPQAVGAAKGKIINAIVALLTLMFLYSFLQWLVPGGIF